MQQMQIMRRLIANEAANIATEAGDLADIFYSADDRQGRLSSDRRKICRANARRAVVSLKERGLVQIYYSPPLRSDAYAAPRMFVEPTPAGKTHLNP